MHGVVVKVLMEEEVPYGATAEMVEKLGKSRKEREVLFVFLTESQSKKKEEEKSQLSEKYYLGH